MALINCPECSSQVSEKAPSCPNCGHPINTAMVQQQPSAVAQHQPMSQQAARDMGQAMANPLIENQQKKSSGGATGALIGSVLGYFMMASSCGMPETLSGFTMTIFIWSPVIGLGMILGYFLGKAVS